MRDHLADFASSRRGVEAFVEPPTNVTATTVVLIAHDGEWTRRAVGSRRRRSSWPRSLGIPVYDVNQTGYPARMREWNSRQRKRCRLGSTRRQTRWLRRRAPPSVARLTAQRRTDEAHDARPARGHEQVRRCQAKDRAAATSAEDVKRKFREALDKKHAHGGRDVSDDGEHGKVDHAQGRRPTRRSRCSAARAAADAISRARSVSAAGPVDPDGPRYVRRCRVAGRSAGVALGEPSRVRTPKPVPRLGV